MMSASPRWILVSILIYSLLVIVMSESEQDGDPSCPADDRFPTPRREGNILFYHFESASSTQDQAKTLVEELHFDNPHSELVIVTSTQQTNGRGTSGRQWMGATGNTFVTIAVRLQSWMDTRLAFTLLPLKMGTVMASQIKLLLDSCELETSPKVTIKWPNDVLVDEKKIAGVLIESTADWFLVGIGVNVGFTPQVPTDGPNRGRTATSVSEYCGSEQDYVTMAQKLGEDMGRDLFQWLLSNPQSNPKVVTQSLLQTWKQWVDWDKELVLRDGDDKTPVIPVDVEKDGRLRVRDTKGKERHVVTDYFL